MKRKSKYCTVSVGQRLICTACNRGRPIYLGDGWVGACAVCDAQNRAHPVSVIGGGLANVLVQIEHSTNRKDNFTKGCKYGEIETVERGRGFLCDSCRRGARTYFGEGKVDVCDICSPAAQKGESRAMCRSIGRQILGARR